MVVLQLPAPRRNPRGSVEAGRLEAARRERRLSEESGPRITKKRLIQGLISIVIVAGIFLGVMPRIANYSDVWATIRDMTGLEIGGLIE